MLHAAHGVGNVITPNAVTATHVSVLGNVTDITTGTPRRASTFNAFDPFEEGYAQTLDLRVPIDAINLAYGGWAVITGALNACRSGPIGGHVMFADPQALLVGSTDVVDVGSRSVSMPTEAFMTQVPGADAASTRLRSTSFRSVRRRSRRLGASTSPVTLMRSGYSATATVGWATRRQQIVGLAQMFGPEGGVVGVRGPDWGGAQHSHRGLVPSGCRGSSRSYRWGGEVLVLSGATDCYRFVASSSNLNSASVGGLAEAGSPQPSGRSSRGCIQVTDSQRRGRYADVSSAFEWRCLADRCRTGCHKTEGLLAIEC